MAQYIQVVEDESDEPVEIPSEPDGTLLLTTLSAQFPGACGLKYRNPDSGAFRGIRLADGILHPPDGIWGNFQYLAVFPKENKRKGEDGYDNPVAKTKRLENQKCSDLIVLGLPWKSTEEDLTKYFQQFGELILVQVKRDTKSGQSKGFGFIRFVNYESQVKCCAQRHMIDGRWCDVTIPNSKHPIQHRSSSSSRQGYNFKPYAKQAVGSFSFGSGSGYEDDLDGGYRQEGNNQMMNRKVFIGRVTEDISAEDLRNYFNKFGEVVDVFIPKPYRAFAFVTFADAETAQALCGEDHIIKGASVHVSSAAPKSFDKGSDRKGFGQGGGGGGGYNQGGGWAQGRASAPGPVGGKVANGADGLGGNLGMNLLNSAMLAAAQAMLQNQGGWGALNQGPSQGGSGGNMGGGDHQAPPPMAPLSNQGGFGSMGGGSGGGGGGSGGNWWSNEGSSTSGGHYSGWGGSHGARGGSGGWS
ncbi:TAR DNA-binding protein 43-like isoform X2 [Biomphalaria glabrata]|uniref:TAR DNA-binding protein 43 n=1 Tax=Biomphalaria glabrata TaxID=6526 RepID=A0A2C9JVD1_BIOGL|nr:TAR DNA-binding protein 43-like isoform X2 [Biomphalaria glabrata]